MKRDREIPELLSKAMLGRLTDEERRRLDEWRAGDGENARLCDEVLSPEFMERKCREAAEVDVARGYARVVEKYRRRRFVRRVAAREPEAAPDSVKEGFFVSSKIVVITGSLRNDYLSSKLIRSHSQMDSISINSSIGINQIADRNNNGARAIIENQSDSLSFVIIRTGLNETLEIQVNGRT